MSLNPKKLNFKICGFVLLCFHLTKAQNLIPDSSFENNRYIPIEFSAINASNSWSRPGMGTTDLFCKCGKKQKKFSLVDVPYNPMGCQKPHSGSCYGGIFAYSHGFYREYLQTPLKQPLEKNKTYRFKMYISLADYSRTAINQLGICFLASKAFYEHSNVITNLRPVYVKIEKENMRDTVNWRCLSITYRARGGESFVLIGSFKITEIQKTKIKAPKEVKSRINQSTERDAYYYIDDVSLVEIPNDPIEDQVDSITQVESKVLANVFVGVPLVLKSILFENNKAVLLTSAYPGLDLIVEYLETNEKSYLEIGGHTDNVGSAQRNQKLSEKRAKAVADYLLAKNIDKCRITYKGYGNSKPHATNETEEGKQENRRVEFILK